MHIRFEMLREGPWCDFFLLSPPPFLPENPGGSKLVCATFFFGDYIATYITEAFSQRRSDDRSLLCAMSQRLFWRTRVLEGFFSCISWGARDWCLQKLFKLAVF